MHACVIRWRVVKPHIHSVPRNARFAGSPLACARGRGRRRRPCVSALRRLRVSECFSFPGAVSNNCCPHVRAGVHRSRGWVRVRIRSQSEAARTRGRGRGCTRPAPACVWARGRVGASGSPRAASRSRRGEAAGTGHPARVAASVGPPRSLSPPPQSPTCPPRRLAASLPRYRRARRQAASCAHAPTRPRAQALCTPRASTLGRPPRAPRWAASGAAAASRSARHQVATTPGGVGRRRSTRASVGNRRRARVDLRPLGHPTETRA